MITSVEEDWNIVSSASDLSLDKNDIIIQYNGSDYTWANATSSNNPLDGPIVSDYFFGWNRTTQTYIFSDILEPGYAFWMYAYEPCMLKRSD